jgi:hypothetical protein
MVIKTFSRFSHPNISHAHTSGHECRSVCLKIVILCFYFQIARDYFVFVH